MANRQIALLTILIGAASSATVDAAPSLNLAACQDPRSSPHAGLDRLLTTSQALLPEVTFRGKSSQFAEVQKLKNCISYSGCIVTIEKIAKIKDAYEWELSAPLDAAALEKISASCPRNVLPLELQPELGTLEVSAPRSYFSARKNIFAAPLSHAEYQALEKTVQKKITELDYDGAIQAVVETLKLDLLGYEAHYDANLPPMKCVTRSVDRTIAIGKGIFDYLPTLSMSIRHELEHVRQGQHADACAQQKLASDFDDHDARERSAYYNDILNRENICADDTECLEYVHRSANKNVARYATSSHVP